MSNSDLETVVKKLDKRIEENQKLRELLRECREIVSDVQEAVKFRDVVGKDTKKLNKLLQKLDNPLGDGEDE